MTPNGASDALPLILISLSVTTIFGHDITFWVVVFAATTLKMITSEPVIHKEPPSFWKKTRLFLSSLLAAVLPPFLATKGIAAWLEITDKEIILLIAVLLVIMGEGIVRWLIKASNAPEDFVKVVKSWFGK